MASTKIFYNTTDEPVAVNGVGEIQPHDHISVTSDYHQPVVLANYPGVVEVTALSPEEQTEFYAKNETKGDTPAPATNPTVPPVNPGAPTL